MNADKEGALSVGRLTTSRKRCRWMVLMTAVCLNVKTFARNFDLIVCQMFSCDVVKFFSCK